jgi:hypothetical protein
MDKIPNSSFVLSVEKGQLEAQAILLVESLRRFGGEYANCPVYAVSPRASRRMGQGCRSALSKLDVHIIDEELISADDAYGPAGRLAACAWAERNINCEILISLDDDLFFVSEPDFRLSEADFFARPVDVKLICTTGAGDPFDAYWRNIAELNGVDYDRIPWVETSIDRIFVKASYNAGMIAVRRHLGIFKRTEQILRAIMEKELSPFQRGELNMFASTGFVGEDGSRWWGASQAALSLAATQLQARIHIASARYNVPAHQAEAAKRLHGSSILKDAILVHYHWLLDKEHFKEDEIFEGGSALPASILKWLKNRTPLNEIEG